MPDVLAIEWVLVPIGFLGALVYGITGFGSPLVTIPLALHFVPLPFALAVFALQDLASSVRVASENPRHAVKGEIVRLVPLCQRRREFRMNWPVWNSWHERGLCRVRDRRE
jgi:hypothetical protein